MVSEANDDVSKTPSFILPPTMLFGAKSAISTPCDASFSFVIDPSTTLLLDTALFANLSNVTAPSAKCVVFIEFTG